MSNYQYNPVPTRAWSRVQGACTYINPDTSYNNAFIPATGQVVSLAQANYEMKQIYKGNILQYKNNSTRFTKSQKYSRLANGISNNRFKSFATQTQTYTNPNTTYLLRVGYQTYPYPNDIVGAPNNISGPFQYNVPNPDNCPTNVVQEGGNLVAGIYVNPCSGKIVRVVPNSATICAPASASNVPGQGVLCWNNKYESYFPRTNYTNNNSGNKWPEGYKGFVPAVNPQQVADCLTNLTA